MLFRSGFVLALSLLLAACATSGDPVAPPPPTRVNIASLPAAASAAARTNDPLERALFAAVNDYRAKIGASPLARDSVLERAAAVHSTDMALRNFFGHFNPDGQGPKERVLAVSPQFKGRIAENLSMVEGMNRRTTEQIAEIMLRGWINSPSHRKNLRNADYIRTGIGIARQGDAIYATQLYAGP